MRIEEDVKLDFCDVLIKPKRSDSPSRYKVDLNCKYKFLNSEKFWEGIPIIAANMATVGTFAMAKALDERLLLTCLHKHYSLESLKENFSQNYFYTIGIKDEDFEKLETFSKFSKPSKICIDVANGYTKYFVNKCKIIRGKYPDAIIMAGNVCTSEMVQELLFAGVDIVKIGIGPGCFIAGTNVLTENGFKKIENIKVGDKVLSHRGKLQKVNGTLVRKENQKLICVNGIRCTENHEFYVLNKKYKLLVNDDNIDEYAEWIEAKDLNKNYFLLKFSSEYLNKIGIELGCKEEDEQNEICRN